MNVNPAVTERLALSRASLRQAMVAIAAPPSPAVGEGADASHTGWRAPLLHNPATRLLLELGQAWWARQPLRLAMPLVTQAAQMALAPTAQRHPVGLVLSAAAVGATVVLARPWRWLPATALLARFVPLLLSEMAKRSAETLQLPPRLPAAAGPSR